MSNQTILTNPSTVSQLQRENESSLDRKRSELRQALSDGVIVDVKPGGDQMTTSQSASNRPLIISPNAVLAASEEDAAAQRRREIRDTLVNGGSIAVNPQGEISKEGSQNPSQPAIIAPKGILAGTQTSGDDAAAQRRREISDMLVRGVQLQSIPRGRSAEKTVKTLRSLPSSRRKGSWGSRQHRMMTPGMTASRFQGEMETRRVKHHLTLQPSIR